jgi:hypothetical protein
MSYKYILPFALALLLIGITLVPCGIVKSYQAADYNNKFIHTKTFMYKHKNTSYTIPYYFNCQSRTDFRKLPLCLFIGMTDSGNCILTGSCHNSIINASIPYEYCFFDNIVSSCEEKLQLCKCEPSDLYMPRVTFYCPNGFPSEYTDLCRFADPKFTCPKKQCTKKDPDKMCQIDQHIYFDIYYGYKVNNTLYHYMTREFDCFLSAGNCPDPNWFGYSDDIYYTNADIKHPVAYIDDNKIGQCVVTAGGVFLIIGIFLSVVYLRKS